MRYSSTLFALAAATVTLAQTPDVGNYTSSLDMEIDPNSVEDFERSDWCNAQYSTCRALCDDNTDSNDCEESDLSYDCTCASNSSAPGLQYYTQTMPTFICQELFSQCNEQQVGNARGQAACQEQIQDLCGEQDPPALGAEEDSTSSATTASTASASESTTSSASDASATDDSVSTTESDGFAAPTMAPAANGVAAVAAIGLLAYLV